MIGLSLSADQTLEIESPLVTLRGGQPVLNGVPLGEWACQVLRLDNEGTELRYTSPSLKSETFQIQIIRSDVQESVEIHYWLESIPEDLVLEAFKYLRKVFRVWRHEWGCGYFKTDFMHFGSEYGPDRAVWHTPGMTRIEIWHHVAEMIRSESGEALWLGCGCPLWTSIGLVDGVRIGRDVGIAWVVTIQPNHGCVTNPAKTLPITFYGKATRIVCCDLPVVSYSTTE